MTAQVTRITTVSDAAVQGFAADLHGALAGPVPWHTPGCGQAGTVHLGGALNEIAYSERQAWEGKIPEKPLVLFAQQSLFDSTRA